MSYFNNPQTEEELKDQYRKLLKKYDYRNPQNAKLLNDIQKEYEETLMKIKRANGYRTPLEKVVDSAKNYVKSEINDYKTAKANEKERIDRLKNHNYTKEEFAQSFYHVKHYLGLIIEELVREDVNPMVMLNRINVLDDVALYQWFNAQDYILIGNPNLMNEYNSAREVLEYSILSISGQTKTENEKNLMKMEGLLGKFFKEQYRKCCDEFFDPIEVAKREMLSQKTNKEDDILFKIIGILIMVFLTIPLDIIFLFLVDQYHFPTFLAVIIVMGTIFLFGNAIGNKIIKARRHTTYSTFGSVEKARVTQEKKYQRDYDNRKGFMAILRLIFSFFRF